MRNSGNTTWTAAQAYRLGAANPYDNFTWGMNRVLLGAADSIAPGQDKVFSWTVTAPATAGTYNFQWRMVRDGVTWFGDLTTNLAITVSAPTPTSTATRTATPSATRTSVPTVASPNAAVVSQLLATAMVAGQQYSVQVTMLNNGGTTWTAASNYRLGAINPYDNTTWGMNRVGLATGESIAPGQQKMFVWTVTAPPAGTYNFQWRMVQDGVAWFGDPSTNMVVNSTAGPPDAAFVSQSIPTTVGIGQQFTASVTMRNTGGTTWTAGALYKLGSINPQDTLAWGANRVALASGESIAPGQQKTFTWTARAPSGAGFYNFQWRMVQDGVTWFGQNSVNVVITVH
jgi:hypothetical protein